MPLIKTQSKILIGVVILIAVVVAAILGLNALYEAGQKPALSSANSTPRIDLNRLKAQYQSGFKTTLDDYLVFAGQNTDYALPTFLAKTREANSRLLSLTVPSEFKDDHLAAVLALAEIERNINSGKLAAITPELSRLRDIAGRF